MTDTSFTPPRDDLDDKPTQAAVPQASFPGEPVAGTPHVVEDDQDDPLDHDATLRLTQTVRRRVVTGMTKGENGFPSDDKQLDLLLRTMKDMDSAANNDRKLRIDDKNSDSSAEVAAAMSVMVKNQMNRNPFQRDPDGSPSEEGSGDHIPSVNPDKLGQHELVEGEGEIGIIAETADTFRSRMDTDEDDPDLED